MRNDDDDEKAFVIDDSDSSDRQAADTDEPLTPLENVLNTRHIRSIALERRAIYRRRTWVIVAAFALIGGLGQTAWLVYAAMEAADWPRAAAYAVVAVAMGFGAFWFVGRVRTLTVLARDFKMPEPEVPPDFSTLGNGSQFVDALERMSDGRRADD